jgi:hypothetical protein
MLAILSSPAISIPTRILIPSSIKMMGIWYLEHLAWQVPVDAPWKCPRAAEWSVNGPPSHLQRSSFYTRPPPQSSFLPNIHQPTPTTLRDAITVEAWIRKWLWTADART